MKQLLMLLLLVPFLGQAQLCGKVQSFRSGDYQHRKDKWTWTDWTPTEPIRILFKHSSVQIRNNYQSTYIMLGEGKVRQDADGARFTTWKAVDEEGKNCTVSLFRWDEKHTIYFSAFYNNDTYCIMWDIDPDSVEDLDKLGDNQ